MLYKIMFVDGSIVDVDSSSIYKAIQQVAKIYEDDDNEIINEINFIEYQNEMGDVLIYNYITQKTEMTRKPKVSNFLNLNLNEDEKIPIINRGFD